MELDWVNSGAPWWRRILTGLDPVNFDWLDGADLKLLELQFSNPIRQV